MSTSSLPVAVIGAGPVGLAAAAHLLEKGEDPIVFEAGDSVGAGVRSWGHVRFFSPWRYVIDQAAARLLAPSGWTAPDPESYPTGDDLVDRYLEPLAAVPDFRGRIAPGAQGGLRCARGLRQDEDGWARECAVRPDGPDSRWR